MNYRGLTPEDIEIFAEAIGTFFDNVTGRPAQVRTAYVFDDPAPIVWNDFNGVIRVSGGFRGSITFAAPEPMLSDLLGHMGEKMPTDVHFIDVAGEIANQMSGRARRHFGEALDISTPIACGKRGTEVKRRAAGPAYAIPLVWGGHEAHLVVHLDLVQRAG
jgi:chemotaxis protein CheX